MYDAASQVPPQNGYIGIGLWVPRSYVPRPPLWVGGGVVIYIYVYVLYIYVNIYIYVIINIYIYVYVLKF